MFDELKKQKKSLNEQYSDLECKHASQIDINEKLRADLTAEEQKLIEMKEFVNGLMKQKEQAIKSDL